MAIFVEIVRSGSIRGAARALKLSPSAVSYHLASLEEHVGSPLLRRSTRSLSTTSQGDLLFQHAEAMWSEAETGLANARSATGTLKGRLAISVTTALSGSRLGFRLMDFVRANPSIHFDIAYTNQQSELIVEKYDVALRAGRMPTSDLKNKKIGQVQRTLVCSPDYLKQRPPPFHPSDLSEWDWVRQPMMSNQVRLKGPGGETATIKQSSRITVTTTEAMAEYATAGLGVATPPSHQISQLIAETKLSQLFPDWQLDPIPIYLVWPSAKVEDPLVRNLIKHFSPQRRQQHT